MRLTDRQTDRQTNGRTDRQILIARPRMHSCSAVKWVKISQCCSQIQRSKLLWSTLYTVCEGCDRRTCVWPAFNRWSANTKVSSYLYSYIDLPIHAFKLRRSPEVGRLLLLLLLLRITVIKQWVLRLHWASRDFSIDRLTTRSFAMSVYVSVSLCVEGACEMGRRKGSRPSWLLYSDQWSVGRAFCLLCDGQ